MNIKVIGFVTLFLAIVGIFLYTRYWNSPEEWNGAAKSYLRSADSLGRLSVRLQASNVKKDSAISILTKEAFDANHYGEQWKQSYSLVVTSRDAYNSQLTDANRRLAYIELLKKNGTLVYALGSKAPAVDSPEVVSAGLSTAERERAAQEQLDTVAKTIGRVQAANARLKRGLTDSRDRQQALIDSTDKLIPGGLFPFNLKRKRQLKKIRAQAQENKNKVQTVIDQQSELEILENTPKQSKPIILN